MSLWSLIRSRFSRPVSADPQIRLRSDGFDVVGAPGGDIVATVIWADVTRIQGYKLDLATTDCICLFFECRSQSIPVQVSEEWPGFQELFAPLSQHFPGIPESWYVDIMTPAFESKRTVLYDTATQDAGVRGAQASR
jgi:hypothetical protein